VEIQTLPTLVIALTRQPFDDYFHLAYTTHDGRKVTEELLPDEARQ